MSGVIATLLAVFKFWDQVTWLVKTLEGTPEQHREEIMKQIQTQTDQFAKTGRPTWG